VKPEWWSAPLVQEKKYQEKGKCDTRCYDDDDDDDGSSDNDVSIYAVLQFLHSFPIFLIPRNGRENDASRVSHRVKIVILEAKEKNRFRPLV